MDREIRDPGGGTAVVRAPIGRGGGHAPSGAANPAETRTDDPEPPGRLAWLAAAQRDRCCYCGCETWLPGQRRHERRLRTRWDLPAARSLATQLAFDQRMASVEHLRRRSEGGDDRPANLALACVFCNSSRGARTPIIHAIAMTALVRVGRHPCHPR